MYTQFIATYVVSSNLKGHYNGKFTTSYSNITGVILMQFKSYGCNYNNLKTFIQNTTLHNSHIPTLYHPISYCTKIYYYSGDDFYWDEVTEDFC